MTSETKYDFVSEIMSKHEKQKAEEPSNGFKLGYAVGMLSVSLALIAAEAGALCFVAFLFSATLTFWQALAIVLIYKYALFQIKAAVSS